MTKLVTALAALKAIELGALEADAPVANWYPMLQSVRVLSGFGRDGQPQTAPLARAITVRDLIEHRAGFGYSLFNAALAQFEADMALPSPFSCTLASLAVPLVHQPGEAWLYGMSTDFLGLVVEQALGGTLQTIFAEHIFEPLGMQSTGFAITAAMRERLGALHRRSPDGFTTVPFEIAQSPQFLLGGAGLYGPVSADGCYQGRRIFSRDLITRLETPIEQPLPARLESLDHSLSLDVVFEAEAGLRWCAGGLYHDPELAPPGHGGRFGWAGLANSFFWIDRKRRIAAVLALQLLPFQDPIALTLAADFQAWVDDCFDEGEL